MRLKVFGEAEQKVSEQLARCTEPETGAVAAVLCADNHPGYSMPIGAAVAYVDAISPSGVGYDIACGNCAMRTDIRTSGTGIDRVWVPQAMDEIMARISFGIGRNNKETVDDPVLSDIAGSPLDFIRRMGWMAAGQLGTVGSGNHYVDLFEDEEGWVWVGVHFGSRGFGHKVATGFLNLAHGREFDARGRGTGDSMDAPPTMIQASSPLGQDYLHAMELAGRYAYAGREWVCLEVLRILGGQHQEKVHNHHNFAWREEHDVGEVLVVRKGCTPSWPGTRSFVGGSMGDDAVILEGLDTEEAEEALFSTVHGAGRVMGRNEAAGRKKWVRGSDGRKQIVRTGGKVDWSAAKSELRYKGVELRGGGAEEAPEVYKRLDDVLRHHEGSVKIIHTLRPIGVAMAGADVDDPYKD
jgi:tRNA-splicing ligase RtcB